MVVSDDAYRSSVSNAYMLATHIDWLKLRLSKTVEDIIIRVLNRAFVGLPMCAHAPFSVF